jgi:hypothetical protein
VGFEDKSEQGQECAISHPLPVNPDGTPMSESQYKAYLAGKGKGHMLDPSGDVKRELGLETWESGDDRSGIEDGIETGSGMEDDELY